MIAASECSLRVQVLNAPVNTEWQLSLKLGFFPITLPYLIVSCADDYSTCMVGGPDRSPLYIMARTPSIDYSAYESLLNLAETLGHERSLIKAVPHHADKTTGAAASPTVVQI